MNAHWTVDADLNARLTLTIERSEYAEAVEKQLTDYRKKARIPGFRPGMAPMTLIRKQYQEPITADEINKRLQDELYAYLEREKIDILGQPLPVAGDLDFSADSHSFEFDLGVAPQIELEVSDKVKIPFYVLEPNEKDLDKEVENLRQRYGGRNLAIIGPAMVEGPVVWGISPETPGTGLGALAYSLRHVAHLGRPKGGSGMLPESLKKAFLQHGGMLRTSTRVVGIVCEGNKVSAVQTSDGATVTSRIVVSACDPHSTFVSWLKNPPARASSLVDRWKNSTPGEGYESKIDAVATIAPVLNGLQHSPLAGIAQASTIVISPSLAELDRGAQMLRDGRTMPRMALLANTPSLIDDTLAPAGRHVFSLEALFTPYSLQGGWANTDEPERWLKQFGSLVQPEFIDSIIDWRVMSPANYESEFHLPKGHATSFAGGPLAAFLGSTPELTRYHTPIKGLYLTGAATFPGAGVWGASGRNAALTILKEMK